MIFTAVDIIVLVVLALILMCGYIVLAITFEWDKPKAAAIVVEIFLMILLIASCGAYRTQTESGKRGLKSWKSETSGGINRTVTVYDVKGKELAKYTGRFDVEENSSEGIVKIKFDCKGKRHIIYAQTGTVLIDEN